MSDEKTPAEKLIDDAVARWHARRSAVLALRLTDPDFRDGYVEGYLDCASAVTQHVAGETLAAVRNLAARRDELTPAEVDAIQSALAADAASDRPGGTA